MGRTYYAQTDHVEKTLTVGELIARLQQFDPTSLVVFKTPLYGAFGSNTAYSIDAIEQVTMERREYVIPASVYEDDETGETIDQPEEIQVFHAWTGVVIT